MRTDVRPDASAVASATGAVSIPASRARFAASRNRSIGSRTDMPFDVRTNLPAGQRPRRGWTGRHAAHRHRLKGESVFREEHSMVRSSIMIGSAVAALTAAAWQGQGQQGFPRPTLDTGPVRVEGSVSVTNTPTVRAEQAGIWNWCGLLPVEYVTPEFVQGGRP